MKHDMKLEKEAFFRIKEGRKIIEVRLNDEKRQQIKIDDKIEFQLLDDPKETISVNVTGLSQFSNFKDLYSSFHYSLFGHPHGTTLKDQISSIRTCYSEEKELKFGSLGIHIRLVS
jgi:ASC-1-like (ASCH) protein